MSISAISDAPATNQTVIGGGLAGCEATATLLRAGLPVTLVDMKPAARSAAHQSELLAELVCSNSLRSDQLANAVGLLKEELRCAQGLLLAAADAAHVPAGRALAVDRRRFSQLVTDTLRRQARCTMEAREVRELPGPADGPVILATGPLTAPALLDDLARATGRERLSFFDALAPIVAGDSIDMSQTFLGSRYGDGGEDDTDYLNCPLTAEEYQALEQAIIGAALVDFHAGESPTFFEGCLPIEEIARRGPKAMAFGPLKPVGLTDPRSGTRPTAVVQLRREDAHGQAYNLVGFQTRIKQSVQPEVFRLIPALRQARFLRLGAMHKNAFLDAPRVLDRSMRLVCRPTVRVAGQLSGVEGYVESIGHGFLTALLTIAEARGGTLPEPPPECAMGALMRHVCGDIAREAGHERYEPHNVHWGLFPPLNERLRGKRARGARRGEVGIAAFKAWWAQVREQLGIEAGLLAS